MPASVNVSGLAELKRDLGLLPDRILDKAERTVGQGMNNIKRDAAARVRAGAYRHLPHLPRSFSYSVVRTGTTIRGEGGADREKLQGKLDIYIEHGTATSAPHPHWSPAFDAELPKFDRYAEVLFVEAIEGTT